MTGPRLIYASLFVFVFIIMSCSDRAVDERIDNNNPQITSDSLAFATGGLHFSYRAIFDDPDGPTSLLEFAEYPSWLAVDGDSLYGTPGDGLGDTGFVVIVSDGIASDSLRVKIVMIPCLVVYGDTRTGHTQHQQLVNQIMALKPSAVFHSGDLVNDGNSTLDWETFNNIEGPLMAISDYYPALGNHELQSPLFFDNFELPGNEQWYSVERNSIHFTVLNSNVSLDPGSEQYQWLVSDLAAVHDSISFIAAVFHHPPYSTGSHPEDEKGLRNTIVSLFQQYEVDIVFNGHDHDYERSYCGDIYYIVTGGGGAPLYDQERTHPCSQLYVKEYHFCKLSRLADRLVVKVFNIESNLIDEFELTSRRSLGVISSR